MKSCCESKSSELLALRERQAHILKIVMLINLVMFFLEFSSGIYSRSTSLMADSLDMLGDSAVYGFSLYVLHRSMRWRSTAALLKGVIITVFGVGVLIEASSKLFSNVIPAAHTMGLIGALALIANLTCLLLLLKHRDDDINMRSTFICSRNDIVSNIGVLFAAIGVHFSGSKWPDVIVGFLIGFLFLRSAWPILVESFAAIRSAPSAHKTNLTHPMKLL